MDKRYNTLTLQQQLQLRRTAVEEVLAHPEWTLARSVRHVKKTMRLTTAELASLAGVSLRTLQEIEAERSEGTVQTMNRIVGVLGLKLGVVRPASTVFADSAVPVGSLRTSSTAKVNVVAPHSPE